MLSAIHILNLPIVYKSIAKMGIHIKITDLLAGQGLMMVYNCGTLLNSLAVSIEFKVCNCLLSYQKSIVFISNVKIHL